MNGLGTRRNNRFRRSAEQRNVTCQPAPPAQPASISFGALSAVTTRLATRLSPLTCLLAGLAVAGCSGAADLLKAPSGLVSGTIESKPAAGSTAQTVQTAQSVLPTLPSLPALPPFPAADSDPVGSPTEIYTRIARGATLCWFGTHGTLKSTHIFNAEAEPPSKGGRAEIVIHERDPSQPNPRGPRAFRIQILPVGDNAKLEVENVRFPIEIGQAMTGDVRRWARDDLTCAGAPQTRGWDAESKPPEAPPAPKKYR